MKSEYFFSLSFETKKTGFQKTLPRDKNRSKLVSEPVLLIRFSLRVRKCAADEKDLLGFNNTFFCSNLYFSFNFEVQRSFLLS